MPPRFIIFIISTVLLCSCGQRTVSLESRLSESESVELTRAFEHLDLILEEKAPGIFQSLRPGTSQEDLDDLRLCLSGNRVEILEKWFLWHNGGAQPLLPSGMPVSLDRSIEDQRILESIPYVPAIRRNSVKILDDLNGDGFFIDVNSSNPLVFRHVMDDPEHQIWFGTLAEFVDFIASGFEAGVLFENEDGRFEYDGAVYEEFMTDYLKRATRWN